MPPQSPQSSLPPGYTLDATPKAESSGLPAGYTLDSSGNSPTSFHISSGTRPLTPPATEQLGAARRFLSNAWEEGKGMVTGVGQAVSAPPTTPIDKALDIMGMYTGVNSLALKRILIDPTIEKGKSTAQALKSGDWMEAGLGAAATLDPFAPDVTKLYDQSASGDVAGAMGRGFTDIAALKGLDLVRQAAKLIDRAPSIEQGKTAYAQQARRAVTQLDHAIGTQGVGARANQVLAADDLHNAQTQSPGYVNGAAVTNQMQQTMNNVGMGANVAPSLNAQMSMRAAKTTMTELGRMGARLDRTGKAPEAATIWSAYDALRDETMKRARALDTLQLGAGHAQAWGDYAKEFREHLKVIHSGPLGALMDGEPAEALDKLVTKGDGMLKGKEVAGKRVVGADTWFKKYGVDYSPIENAMKAGKTLKDLSDMTSNMLMGKIKMIARHPVVGIPMIMAEARALKGLGIGGGLGSFVLPLIIAAKVGKLLDHVQIHSLLVDIGRRMPAEDMSISAEPLGPYNAMQGPIGPGGAPQPAGGGGMPQGPAPQGGTGVPPANIPPSPFGGGSAATTTPQAVAQQLGISYVGSGSGIVHFQDPTTGGGVSVLEKNFSPEAVQGALERHRASIDTSQLSETSAEKGPRAQARMVQEARKSKGKE